MGDQAREGRTVLLVSHNMGSINQLCEQCLWLHDGRLRQQGDTAAVVESYLEYCGYTGVNSVNSFAEDANKPSQLRTARTVNEAGVPTQNFSCDEPVIIELVYQVHYQLRGLYAYLQVTKTDGTPVMASYSYDLPPNPLANLPVGTNIIRLRLPPRTLSRGHYTIQFSTASPSWAHWTVEGHEALLPFFLDDLIIPKDGRAGYFSTLLKWEVEPVLSGKSTWDSKGKAR